jgi:hypothetical protein
MISCSFEINLVWKAGCSETHLQKFNILRFLRSCPSVWKAPRLPVSGAALLAPLKRSQLPAGLISFDCQLTEKVEEGR